MNSQKSIAQLLILGLVPREHAANKLKSTNSPALIFFQSFAVTGGNDTVSIRELVSDESEVLICEVPIPISLGTGGG